jgi:hypothetical protein
MSNNFNQIRSHIIDYLYDKLEISDYRYTIIKNISDLFALKNNKYYVSSNSCGTNSFLVFTKNKNNFYSYYIDRRSISFNKQMLKKETVRMNEINIPVDKELFNGTIFDGIWIDEELSSNNHNLKAKKKYFIVTDIYEFCGKKYITMDYFKKMSHFELYFNNFFDNSKSDIEIIIQRPFEINQIESMFNEHINKNARKLNIKGISFYPMYSGMKLIYLFDRDDEEIKNELINGAYKLIKNNTKSTCNNSNEINNNDSDNKKIYKFRPSDINSNKEIILNFLLKKTRLPDVYNMYSIFNENSKYIYKYVDIAYIPSYDLSVQMRTLFLNESKIIFECKFDYDKCEWIPIKAATIQKIDIINTDNRIQITEEYIKDDDDDDYLQDDL